MVHHASLDLVVRNTTRERVPMRQLVMRAIDAAWPYLKIPRGKTAELSVTVVGPARMRALNRRYRNIDTPTDVLSFPLPGPNIQGYTAVSLGDLFICPAVVRKKAQEWDRSLVAQLRWTIVHGILHLVGYDHERDSRAAARMAAMEKKVLKRMATP
jgi:probable rRNA maturation factor